MPLSRRRKLGLSVLGLALLVAVAVAAAFWRGVPFPRPTGRFAVGRASYDLVDSSRPEIFTAEPDDFRELVVTVYYPAEIGGKHLAPYTDPGTSAAIADALHTPRFVAGLMRSHAIERVGVANHEGGFPVVIFSPGFGTPPLFYTATLEDLASHGFVVVSLCHPYSTSVVTYPDGRVIKANEAGTKFEVDKRKLSEAAKGGNNDSGVSFRTVTAERDAIGEVWLADARFVLDRLARLNQDDQLLSGHLDLSRVGIFGHSFGGATAAAAVERDERFQAGINMDGSDFSVTDTGAISRPFLWLQSPPPSMPVGKMPSGKIRQMSVDGAPAAIPTPKNREPSAEPSKTAARVVFEGIEHTTFISDVTLLSATFPFSRFTGGSYGTLNGRRAVSMIDAIVVGFFRKHLQGESVPLLDNPSAEFPEAKLIAGPPRGSEGMVIIPRPVPSK